MTTSTSAVSPYVRDLSAALLARSDELGAELAELIMSSDIRYRDENVVTTEDLVRSCRDNIELLFASLAGAAVPQTEGPRETGRRTARQGMPLSATLRGYRIGGRFIWNVLVRSSDHTAASREALLQAAEVIWALIDDYSEVLTEAVRETIADQARHDTHVRTAVLDSILSGSLGDGPALWDAATTLGLPHRGVLVVVAAETRQSGDEPLPGVEQTLREQGVSSAWRLDGQHQIGVLAPRQGAMISAACDRLTELATARIGVSETFPRLELAPDALRQARIACVAAAPGSREVVAYEPGSLAVLLASGQEAGRAFARAVLQPVLELPTVDRSQLLETLRTWYTENGSTSAAAARLYVHRNTVRYRLRRIEKLTDLELANPGAIGQLHAALEATRIFGLDREPG